MENIKNVVLVDGIKWKVIHLEATERPLIRIECKEDGDWTECVVSADQLNAIVAKYQARNEEAQKQSLAATTKSEEIKKTKILSRKVDIENQIVTYIVMCLDGKERILCVDNIISPFIRSNIFKNGKPFGKQSTYYNVEKIPSNIGSAGKMILEEFEQKFGHLRNERVNERIELIQRKLSESIHRNGEHHGMTINLKNELNRLKGILGE